MALLKRSSPVGTSSESTSTTLAFEKKDTPRSISISTTNPTTLTNRTTTTTPTTTKSTATANTQTTLANKSATNNYKSPQPSSTTTTSFISQLRPLLSTTLKTLYQTHALLFSLIFSATLLLFVRCFSLLHSVVQLILLWTSFATKLFVYRTLLFVKTITMETASVTWNIWDSRKARQIRKKIEFEFFVWILGPGGNLLCFLLWPGWIVLGLMIWGLSCLMTGVQAAVLPVSG